MRGSGIESCGLRNLLNYDGTFHWHGSASNVSGPAFRAVNNLVPLLVSLSRHIRVLCTNERRLPTIAAAYALIYRPTAKQASESHLISLFHEWNRDFRTRKARAPPLVQHITCCALCMGVVDWHNCGTVPGALESGLGIGLGNYLYFVTLLVGMGPL